MAEQFTPYRSGHHIVKEYDFSRLSGRFRAYREKWATYPKQQIVGDFPINVDLELSAMCNLRCPMCHTLYIDDPSYAAYKRGDATKFMSFETFQRAIDEAVGSEDFAAIKLNFRGESTLHPEIDRCVRYAREKGVLDILLNSNGNYPPELNDRLAEAGLSEVAYSLDALTPETYKKVRVGGEFFTAYANVMLMLKHRDQVRVRVSYVRQQANNHETDAFVQFWTRMGVDRILVSDVYNPAELINGTQAEKMAVKRYVKPDRFTCPQLWQRLIVLHNGDVYPCCHSFEEPDDLKLGNVFEATLESMWHGEKLTRLRRLHAEGRYQEIESCARCAYPKQPVEDAAAGPNSV